MSTQQTITLAEAKQACKDEWADVNDPPCHPGDEDWRPCSTCAKHPIGMTAQIVGYACTVLDTEAKKEFLSLHTFGISRTKARNAFRALNSRRIERRKMPFGYVGMNMVGVAVLEGQPPVDNKFVQSDCERFK